MKRVVYFFAVAAMLAGCATPLLQSRDELKSFARDHATVMIYESYTSSRRFEEVAATLQGKWEACYGKSNAIPGPENGTPTSRAAFHPHFLKVNSFLFEMSLQTTQSGAPMQSKMPEGGSYLVALDVERLLGGKTRLTWHSAAKEWKEQWELSKQWSDGKDAACL